MKKRRGKIRKRRRREAAKGSGLGRARTARGKVILVQGGAKEEPPRSARHLLRIPVTARLSKKQKHELFGKADGIYKRRLHSVKHDEALASAQRYIDRKVIEISRVKRDHPIKYAANPAGKFPKPVRRSLGNPRKRKA